MRRWPSAAIIPLDELTTYGADESRLEMSTLDTTPGVEMIGGSLGHGLGQGVGQALGLRLDGSPARVFVELSDGEMQEGATWEAAMAGASFGLDELVALIDCNGIQADGRIVLDMEPVAEKWRAFGWETKEIDGNDIAAVVAALQRGARAARQAQGDRAPHAARQGRADARDAREGAFRPRRPGEWDGSSASSNEWRRRPMAERARTLAMGQDEATAAAAPRSTRRSARRWRRSGASARRSSG